MKFEYEKSWDNFETVFNEKLTIQEAWRRIIDYHAELKPKEYWESLRQLNVAQEQVDIKEWIENIVSKSPLPDSVTALWIGITKLWDEENESEFYAIYLHGSDSYDQNDIDWAVNPSYEPENNYGVLQILNQVDGQIQSDSEDYSFLDWILPVAYCSLTIDEIIRANKLNKGLFLKYRKQIFVSTGFDDGDYMNLSVIE